MLSVRLLIEFLLELELLMVSLSLVVTFAVVVLLQIDDDSDGPLRSIIKETIEPLAENLSSIVCEGVVVLPLLMCTLVCKIILPNKPMNAKISPNDNTNVKIMNMLFFIV